MRKVICACLVLLLAALCFGADKVRNWRDASGSVLLEGMYVSHDDSVVRIDPGGNKLIRQIKLDKLSEVDRAYLEGLADAKPKAPVDPTPDIVGEVVGVTDGDTITLKDASNTTHKIGLEGIDAPEAGQDFGMQAKKTLSSKVFGKQVKVTWESKDKYSRILGHIYVGKQHINEELLREGMAWHYKEYNSDHTLSEAEETAKSKQLGLWKDADAIAPWDFRHGISREPTAASVVATVPEALPGRTEPVTTKPRGPPGRSSGIVSKPELDSKPAVKPVETTTVYITKTGSKYHRSGCRHLAKSKIAIGLEEAQRRYGACSVCDPP